MNSVALQEELQYNPFLRCHDPVVQRHCGTYPAGCSGCSSDSAAAPAGNGAAGAAAGPGAASEQASADDSAGGGGGAASTLAVRDESAAVAAGGASEMAHNTQEDEIVIRTLTELRRRKDGHGVMAKLVTAAVTVGAWVGWAP